MSAAGPPACNACGGHLEPRFPEVVDPQTRERFAIEACARCGLGHTVPVPEDLGPYYGPRYHGGRHGITAAWGLWRRVGFVNELLPGKRGRALDVGCGDGHFLLALAKQGWSVVGTEMNVELARAQGLEVLETVAEAGTGFDLVTSWHSLEHMRDPAATVRDCAAALAPGGVLLVAVPNAEGAQAKVWGRQWVHLDVPRHLFHFGPRSLRLLVEGQGLVVEKQWHHELEMDLFGWTQSALNVLLGEPNVLFDALTGRPTRASRSKLAASFVFGGVFTAAALPAFAASTAVGEGGTLVIAARKPG